MFQLNNSFRIIFVCKTLIIVIHHVHVNKKHEVTSDSLHCSLFYFFRVSLFFLLRGDPDVYVNVQKKKTRRNICLTNCINLILSYFAYNKVLGQSPHRENPKRDADVTWFFNCKIKITCYMFHSSHICTLHSRRRRRYALIMPCLDMQLIIRSTTLYLSIRRRVRVQKMKL